MSDRSSPCCRRVVAIAFAAALAIAAPPVRAAAAPAADTAAAEIAVDQFSPGFLGIYRKVMEIEDEIQKYAEKYDVDMSLARAVCMYESGGNANLTSGAGARGYFQVMPATFRLLRVKTNIEAGVKYLGQLIHQFDREDYALAAYNGGPGRVVRGRGLPLESLQYVLGVGHYRSVLRMYGPQVRKAAETLALTTSRRGDTWASLAERLGMPVLALRLYNPFLTASHLRSGERLIAYPEIAAAPLLITAPDGELQYRARLGDNYFNIAFAFEVDLDALRNENDLWRLQVLPAGMVLTIPQGRAAAEPQPAVERAAAVDAVPAVERAARDTTPPAPKFGVHRVRRGENLTVIARRYGTTVRELRSLNRMRSSLIRAGQRLRVPLD